MMDDDKVDLGTVHIHKKVLADIAALAIRELNGVSLIPQNIISQCMEFFGRKYYPGIVVTMDKSGQIVIDMKIFVRYGINISDMAKQVQDTVRSAIERTVDINLKDINVNIEGIERGET